VAIQRERQRDRRRAQCTCGDELGVLIPPRVITGSRPERVRAAVLQDTNSEVRWR
jgi:hypothetical protein